MSDYLYTPGSSLEVPGIEATLEYGDASNYEHGRIPGALRINDRSTPDQVHITEISGLHDDPEVGDSRTERAGHFGERAGILIPRGRTIGLTGYAKAGNVARMRDLWRRMRAQFGRVERDLIIHPPVEAPHYVNEVWSESTDGWVGRLQTTGGATIPAPTIFEDGTFTSVRFAPTGLAASTNQVILQWSADPIVWEGEDLWMTAIVTPRAAAASVPSIALVAYFIDDTGAIVGTWTAIGAGVITSPTTTLYYRLAARMSATATVVGGGATRVIPAIVMNTPATAGAYTLQAGRVSAVLLNADDPTPLGYVGNLPGFEHEGPIGASRSYGPCYTVNQVADPNTTSAASWANDSTSGAAVDVGGNVLRAWPGDRRRSSEWVIRNPSTTSRTLAVRVPAVLSEQNLFVVAAGRQYRAHVRLRVNQFFTTGALQIVWLDEGGSVLSTSTVDTFDPVPVGGIALDVEVDGSAQAPNLAQRAYVRIASSTPSTVSGQQLSILITEPRFFDISEYDVGDVAFDDMMPQEIGILGYTPTRAGSGVTLTPRGSLRRIPRPFLLRKVRSLWDGKAPESQRNLQYRRDFTMSMRSSDPRIYVLDKRHAQLKMSGSQSLLSRQMQDFKQLLDLPWSTDAMDDYSGTTAGGTLNGRTAPTGQTWATSGDTGDFTFADTGGGEQIVRSVNPSSSGRYAIIGSANYVDVFVSTNTQALGFFTGGAFMSVIARYASSSAHLKAVIQYSGGGSTAYLYLQQVGPLVESATVSFPFSLGTYYSLRMSVNAAGYAVAQVATLAGAVIAQVEMSTSDLASGGALQTGKIGLWDASSASSGTRYYDGFEARKPAIREIDPAPNFTFEGSSLDPIVGWKTAERGSFPLDGVGLGANEFLFPFQYLTQASLARMYYSSGLTAYTTPQVTVSGDCIHGAGFDYDLFTGSFIGGAWQYNYIGVLLKRVSSSAWIELRYNSANNTEMSAVSSSPAPPFSLELWSSHNAAGSASVTRLAAWDVPTANITDGVRKHVRAYMDTTGAVYAELWDFNTPNLNDTGLIARHSYTLPGALSAVIGPAVAGRAGMMARLGQWDDGLGNGINVGTMNMNYASPYLASFEAVDFIAALQLLNCPVIGDSDDIPVSIQLRGGIDSPKISLSSLDSGQHATLALSGVFTDADPVTIDMDAGTIKSASGANYFNRRLLGSRFFSLAPGQNIISVQAAAWDTAAPAHVIATWRDCLR